MRIKILTDQISSRLLYAADFIFNTVLKVDYALDVIQDENVQYHIVYGSNTEINAALFVPCHGIMFETGFKNSKPNGEGEGFNFRMFNNDNRGLGYDLFAMTFYILSRYEEYYENEYDQYGRVSIQRLDLIKHRFEHIPLLDVLIASLAIDLTNRFPDLRFQQKEFNVLPGIDIDFMYLFEHRSSVEKFLSFSKSILKNEFGKGRDIFKSIFQKKQDPYANFSDWLPTLEMWSGVKNIFVLCALKNQGVDKNLSVKNPLFPAWLKNIESTPELYIGWHPSVQAGSDRVILEKEKTALEEVVGYNIEKSRQHFLSLKLPETYRSLLSLGIKEEHSMGFNNRTGFRASTAHPFFWYDIQEEKKTNLKVFPFVFMDVQLRDYLGLDQNQSIELINRYIEQLKQTGGVLSFIWHNSSFYGNEGWTGWDKVYEFLLRKR